MFILDDLLENLFWYFRKKFESKKKEDFREAFYKRHINSIAKLTYALTKRLLCKSSLFVTDRSEKKNDFIASTSEITCLPSLTTQNITTKAAHINDQES